MNDPTQLQRARALMEQALADLRKYGDIEYAEARFVNESTERIRVSNMKLEGVDSQQTSGIAFRVIAHGQWGFAAASGDDPERVRSAAQKARDVAIASAVSGGEKVVLAPLDQVAKGIYRTELQIDPFAISLEEKLGLLVAATRALKGNHSVIRRADASMGWTKLTKLLLTSEGTDVEQHFTYGGAGMFCIAINDEGLVQRRSFPSYLDGEAAQGGYERVQALDMVAVAPSVSEEAIALLSAPALPAGKRTVILESSQLALQIHESCGHPTELDRAYGMEISLAGGSFLQPSMLGNFQYGSSKVNLTADATSPGGLGTFGWDDEGVTACKTPLVTNGRFVGYLSSRETAAKLNTKSSGSMRAQNYGRIPLIRMVNINLEPDPNGGRLDDLIADTKDGLYIATNKSWSIDDLRLNFQFGCEVAWEIKNGKRTTMYRNPVYTGITPQFWGNCNAICNEKDWKLWGILNCGKGEPTQLMPVGHGTAPARFDNVEVGHG